MQRACTHAHTHTHTDISMVTPMKGPLLSLYHVWLILWGSWSALGFSNNCSIPLISYLLSPASSHSLTHSCCGVDLIKVSGCDLLSWTYVHILGETVSLELSNCWKKKLRSLPGRPGGSASWGLCYITAIVLAVVLFSHVILQLSYVYSNSVPKSLIWAGSILVSDDLTV